MPPSDSTEKCAKFKTASLLARKADCFEKVGKPAVLLRHALEKWPKISILLCWTPDYQCLCKCRAISTFSAATETNNCDEEVAPMLWDYFVLSMIVVHLCVGVKAWSQIWSSQETERIDVASHGGQMAEARFC